MPRSSKKEASSRLCIVGWYRAWDTGKLSEQSRIGFVRLIWIILHQGVSYEERGPAVTQKSKRRRATRMIRELRSLGYEVQPLSVQLGTA